MKLSILFPKKKHGLCFLQIKSIVMENSHIKSRHFIVITKDTNKGNTILYLIIWIVFQNLLLDFALLNL